MQYHPGRAQSRPDASRTVYRALLLRVAAGIPEATIERFERDLLKMPGYIESIVSWRLSRVEDSVGPTAWTHVWEQEFSDHASLMGQYLDHPIHWGVVDRWFEAAYLGGDYPRTQFADSWPGFTGGAQKLARQRKRLTSNYLLGDNIDGVTPVRKVVRVDVFSPDKRPAGATARFRLVYDTTGDIARRVKVNGRLVLTRANGRWKVFGFDIARAYSPG